MGKELLITDTHFGHKMLIDKGFRPMDFELKIYQGLKERISRGDTIFHLGDVTLGNNKMNNETFTKFCHELGAKAILIRGNHDKESDTCYYNLGWDFVCDQLTLKKYGKRIVLSHIPLKKFDGDINIHGHWHDNDHRKEFFTRFWYGKKHKVLSIEKTQYKPVALRDFIL